jgi:hypothetical protein
MGRELEPDVAILGSDHDSAAYSRRNGMTPAEW